MTLLIVGIVIWVALHFLKRVAPGLREQMNASMGEKLARGVISLLLLGSIVLMVIGYRVEPYDPVFAPMAGMGHLNNLLMLVAVILLGAGSSKGKARAMMRHPMLTGVIVWAVAHLLVNGDLASIILFGSMGVWAVVQMLLINRAEPNWVRPEPGPFARDIRLLVISLVVFAVIAAIHIWLGHNPFMGTYA
jgi:uncharacterized membrane protein